MQNRLLMCSIYLEEAEEKLSALQDSSDADLAQRFGIAEALSFVRHACNAISQARTQRASLQQPSQIDVFIGPLPEPN